LGSRPVPLRAEDLATLHVRQDPEGGWLVSDQGRVLEAPDRYRLTVPAKGDQAVDFPIYVHGYPPSGELGFQSVFESEGDGDGLKRPIPVVPFARRQTEVTLAQLGAETRIPVPARPGTFQAATE